MAERIVIAVDSFKGTIGAADAARCLREGWLEARPSDDVVLRPMADGGEGTVDAFAAAVPGASRRAVTVHGPEGTPVAASWLLLPPTAETPAGTAVVELANTSGIELLETLPGGGPRRRPFDAGTRGFGEAIADALAHGITRLVLGIGSSASTDGGAGMLSALGARFTDAGGRAIVDGARGLAEIAAVDLSGLPALPAGGVTVLTDVTNPLQGARGAAAVFGPQKGAGPADVSAMDAALGRFAALVGRADPVAPGAGAAGGTGYGLLVWGATLVPGSAAVADLIGLRAAVAEASVVITGEGSFDIQSASGKVPSHVAALAAQAGVPVRLVAGRIAPDAPTSAFSAAISLTDLAGSAEASMSETAHWLRVAGARLAAEFSR
ncbi:glycerate kinase [Microbacterium sp. P01]|uniref:glycerate kinase n=1 Tax=unclassified Microbacterium TaxID=2609290 RepID=UPI00366ED348